MSITTSTLTRAAGVSAALAGLIYIVIQFIHPSDVVASITTPMWVVVHLLSLSMAVLALIGLAGLYLSQVRQLGLLGLIGYLMFSFFFILQSAFNFAEALIAPLIADVAPQFAEDFVGLFGRYASQTDLGPLALVVPVGSALYIVGALIFGIAILRGRVLSRGAGILLIVAAVLTPVAGLLPHTVERLAAIPMGLALIWLGYSLWSARRSTATGLTEPAERSVTNASRTR
ncbi:hypothetical protein BJQ94_18790 [Cryobacterium sp. SO2]|uniref:hypothetical protein n=1 Tax=Cryobacterium sp. SO2 TaxID=1897060 RepID=UPI00223DD113|nr:hypothetical protein [Cryobacterium sp. SO2]WEO77370.1 hypothetical protein BJQ94_18790 [Cryobacterium sp. SO2]